MGLHSRDKASGLLITAEGISVSPHHAFYIFSLLNEKQLKEKYKNKTWDYANSNNP